MKALFSKSCVYASICLLFAVISTASAATYVNLIVFGDSLSDAASGSSGAVRLEDRDKGNNTWVKTQGKTGAPITNIDPVSNTSALWSNFLIVDKHLFEENPNGTRLIYPSSQALKRGYSPLRYSMNYAWASAETGDHYINDLSPAYVYNDALCQKYGPGEISSTSSCVPSVLLQVKTYLKEVHHHPNPKSLFILWAGGNDLFNNIGKVAAQNKGASKPLLLLKMLNTPFPLFPSKEDNTPLSNPVKNLKLAIIMLIQAGVPAQNIYVLNLPDLAKTPAAQSFVHGNKIMLYSLTAITEIYNLALRANLAFNYFQPMFNLPNGNVISIDSIFRDLLKNHQALGFNQDLQNCVQDNAVPDCKGYIFFNGKHPTVKAHQYIAKFLKKRLALNN